MTQEDKLNFLIDFLKKESIMHKDLEVAKEDRQNILRSLMNIRMPKPVPKEILDIQDSYLKEESRGKGIVTIDEIQTIKDQFQSNHPLADKISIWQGDITRISADAIVNAANSQMLGCFVPCHKCIDNAIHSAAGIELRDECNQYMNKMQANDSHYEEPTGRAVITGAYNLPCKYVLHTVGPFVRDWVTDHLRRKLQSCYKSCLNVAIENGLRSIVFCCISTGEFHFPNEEAAKIAVETVSQFLSEHPDNLDRVIFNVYKDYDQVIYEQLLS